MPLTVVLAVGMDSTLIATSRSVLQSAGYVVISTRTIHEAIDQFRIGDFDLVFLDDSITAQDRTIFTVLVRLFGSRTPVVSRAGLVGDCEQFADVNNEGNGKALLMGFGAFISEIARLQPIHPKVCGNVPLEERRYEATGIDVTKRRGPYKDDCISPGWNVGGISDDSIHRDLERALERNELELHYQPKIDLRTGAMIGVEALTRWMHPTRGLVTPTRFITIAEQSGQMLGIGAWVLREACTQAKTWMDAGMDPIKVAVNVSEIQLQNEKFSEVILAILSETELDPRFLELDVCANVLLKQLERTTQTLKAVKEKGVLISADNLGASHTNFGSLRKLPLDALKIDRSFVRKITSGSEGKSKVSSIISLGHRMNLRVVAEGVEEAGHLEFLWEQSCDEAQGYYFGEPMPAEQLARRRNHDGRSTAVV
jgi:EAL domain-containing protein (putative c-di-GMP-specific phosphodiesterase class I)